MNTRNAIAPAKIGLLSTHRIHCPRSIDENTTLLPPSSLRRPIANLLTSIVHSDTLILYIDLAVSACITMPGFPSSPALNFFTTFFFINGTELQTGLMTLNSIPTLPFCEMCCSLEDFDKYDKHDGIEGEAQSDRVRAVALQIAPAHSQVPQWRVMNCYSP
jgi:hypothetical protein